MFIRCIQMWYLYNTKIVIYCTHTWSSTSLNKPQIKNRCNIYVDEATRNLKFIVDKNGVSFETFWNIQTKTYLIKNVLLINYYNQTIIVMPDKNNEHNESENIWRSNIGRNIL